MMIGLCLVCNEILISVHRHDFQECSCKQHTFIDGGGERGSRYGGVFLDLVGIIG